MRRIRHGTDCMHSMIDGRRARAVVLAGWLAMGCAGATFAQAPVVTAENYARAEKFLSHNAKPLVDHAIERSEEHTSELPSLMRNSYAVFCLKKKQSQHT